jgi:pimeloyl-ACP methyl ester carboxylesterase
MGKLFPAFSKKAGQVVTVFAFLPAAAGRQGWHPRCSLRSRGVRRDPPTGGADVPSRISWTARCLRRVTHLKIYQNISKAQLFIMPGATHFMLREEYSLFNQIVERFLGTPFNRPATRNLL